MTPDDLHRLPALIPAWARELGFDTAAIATLELDQDHAHLQQWLAQGRHGEMAYMARNTQMRQHPEALREGTLSVISVRMNYRTATTDAMSILRDGNLGYVSRYALGRDYHRLMRGRLQKLGQRIEQAVGPHGYRVFSDSAPVLEKALARNAGLGWIGKHTLLLNRDAGSWFFLGEIYTDLLLTPTAAAPVRDECGRCSACIKVCPTQAIVAPHQLDARRCISYLTIEHHGSIPLELRPMMGNRIFGCDDCQLVCPWNRYASLSTEPDFAPRHELDTARLIDLFAWSESLWLQRTEGMALRRTGYARWLRNLAVALGNAPSSDAVITSLRTRADHPDPIVQEHVAWALQQHGA
ncbi:tRNA epoxyqueuosine(34) reductase QueG [Sinimarinibacterium sp. CAU 1509]|uniref:tRNA epoxyqueuosine(34) reductase QueG n=1 Tax=Sinimarinibacterium sp. CAU 1509 TaxID=2562283 RepID=UPI0010ACFFA8|nr:tRNA epoxyqueuosine(34) reductase QueG [Sinimarinibacterium sp. CAU 1509]TJY60932.1 tRNA epoxyqueuosine(34) reductase QueG [Sinimarinibacterium sp. CAU 1509]